MIFYDIGINIWYENSYQKRMSTKKRREHEKGFKRGFKQ